MKKSVKYAKILLYLLSCIVFLLVLVFVVPRVLVFFMPFVVGFILSLIANPLVRFLEKKIKIKRKYSTVLLIVLVIGVLVLGCYGIGAALVIGLRGFMEYLPTMYENAGVEVTSALASLQRLLHKVPFFAQMDVEELSITLQDSINGFVNDYKGPTVSAISGFAKSIPDVLVSVLMGLLATYFFIADRDRLLAGLNRHIPATFREKTMTVYTQILRAVGGYFKAQLKIMGVVYVIITIGLMLLRVRFAWLIGFGIAFLDMLPIFGTGTVLVPWAAVKIFSGNISTALCMLALYAVALAVHQLLQPKLVGESVGLDAFATLFFMFIGYQLRGVLGMIVAIPIGMLLCSFYEAGAFNHLIWCLKEIGRDLAEFCRIDTD